jgi:HSP20 family protein
VEDLDINLEGETLTLQGKRNYAGIEGEGLSYHRREIESGSFNRAIALPLKVDVEAVGATLVNGILTITLPKAVEARPRQINVAVE